jgi:hypothetical protein
MSMESIEKKIARLLKTPPIFNWALHNFLRFDDTKRSLARLAQAPVGKSLRSTYRICGEIAHRRIGFDEAMQKITKLKGYSQKAAKQIVPAFYDYFISNQMESVPDFEGDVFPYPIGRAPDGTTLTIPVKPLFVAIQGDRLLPVFLLGWKKVPFDLYRIRLISTIIQRSVLTWEDFRGCDALVVTFPADKWSDQRISGGWYVSRHADMTDEELHQQFDRYNRALHEIISELQS